MKSNEIVREQIFEIIKNQIKMKNPPEVKITYERLRKLGFDDFVTKQYLGQCLGVELFHMLKYKEEWNLERYVKNLQNLPKEPFED